MADDVQGEVELVSQTVGAFLSDPKFISTMSQLSEEDKRSFLDDPKGFLAGVGFPLPADMTIVTSPAPENFHLGKFKICVDFPVHACYCHGPGEKC